jgi:DNA-binding transcriptional regulator YiaG
MVIIQEISKLELEQAIKSAVESAIGGVSTPQRDRLLSRQEASVYLGISLPTLNAWEKSGQLQPKRYGNRVYYFESDLLMKK